MVLKEDLYKWFKNLQPRKRMDYMCGLMHMCLPLELRFIGTVLEDLAKKDFHCLRDAEIKANNAPDLSNNNSGSLADSQLRAKILLALTLMNSTNSSCAEIIFSILKTLENLTSGPARPTLLHNRVIAEEVNLILTLAIHHPAFKASQKLHLGDVLKSCEKLTQELFGDDDEDPGFILPSKPHPSFGQYHPIPVCQSQAPVHTPTPPDKGTLKCIEIKGTIGELKGKKGGVEYQIHTTWSNGETTEVYMKFKQLQDIHRKLLCKFPEEKKQHLSIPVFPGPNAIRDETIKGQITALNTYLRDLVRAPSHILDCEILANPLRSGTLVNQQPPPTCRALSGQPHLFPASSLCDDNGAHVLHQLTMPISMDVCPNSTVPGQFPMQVISTSMESPVNSRTSSPALVSSQTNPGSSNIRTNHVIPGGKVRGAHPEHSRNIELSLTQLLCLLNLEKFSANLSGFSFKQMISMSQEDFARAGLPPEARGKLHTILEQLKPTQDNGLIDPVDVNSSPACPVMSHVLPGQVSFVAAPPYTYPPFVHHPMYGPPQHNPPIARHSSPHSHTNTVESSPANSEVSSPPPSPSLVLQTTDSPQGPPHMMCTLGHGPAVEGAPLPMMSPPAAVAASSLSPATVKLTKHTWPTATTQLDSSGSEEDRAVGYDQGEAVLAKSRGHGRPQQTVSLPVMNHNLGTMVGMEDGKMAMLPNSVSIPHPALVSMEPSGAHTPPSGVVSPQMSTGTAMMNGYMSDPPPLLPQGSVMTRSMHNMRAFKNAQPTHTAPGMHKNVVNMPGPPPPVSFHCHTIHPHHSFMNPPIVSTTSNNPGNPQAHTVAAGFQSPPPTSSAMVYSVIMRPPNLTGSMPPPLPPRTIFTSVASSTSVMTTVPSNMNGPSLSHSPSPISSDPAGQLPPPLPYLANTDGDPTWPDGLNNNNNNAAPPPPSQTPPQPGSKMGVLPGNGMTSGTPSPPLVPVGCPKHLPTGCVDCNTTTGAGQPQAVFIPHMAPYLYPLVAGNSHANGLVTPMAHLFSHPQHPPSQQSFPNGVATPDIYLSAHHRFPAHVSPYFYGNSVYQAHVGSNNQAAPTVAHTKNPTQGPPVVGGAAGNKSVCYNCGHVGHKASECSENTMENMTNTFRLNIKPKSDSE